MNFAHTQLTYDEYFHEVDCHIEDATGWPTGDDMLADIATGYHHGLTPLQCANAILTGYRRAAA
jgi:hypothetical protein